MIFKTISASLVVFQIIFVDYSGNTSFIKLDVFKYLFSSLELATNCDGQDRMGSESDNEINRISGTELSEITNFRNFNARTKHIDKNDQDVEKYNEGIDKLDEMIILLRKSVKNIMID